MCVLGLAGGSVETFASISLTADAHSASSKPLCISQAFYSIGAFVAPQAASLFLGRPGGWKPAFLVLAALALSMTLFFTVFGREPARATVAVKSANKTGARDDAATARGNSVLSFRALLFAYVMVEALCASWLPYMLENRRGFGAGEAASTASFYWLGMIAGRMAVTLLPDRLTLRPALIVSSLLAVMAAFTVFMFPGSSLIPLAVLGFAMGPIWPITVRMAAATLRSDSLTASVIAVGGLGAAAGPLFGSLLLAWGLAHLYFPALALFCLAVAAMIMVASVPRKVGKP
jgi:fucose permease